MSTVTLRIQVDKSGATENIGEVKRGLSEMGTAGQQGGQQAAQGVGALRSALDTAKSAVASFVAAYAAIQTLRGVVNLSDEYQGLSDRLRLATADSGTFAAAQAGVFQVAQQTGTALGAVTDLYVALSNSTKQLGLDQGQLMTITQAINQAFVVSGTSAASAEAATRQLGQAFASGVLRGDEFNSMMENAPGLASALAASLGVTAGQLRAMAAEGKLTSDVLAQGLLTQAPAIAAQFDAMGLTVGRAFTQLSNAVLKFVGEASQASGAGNALAQVISGLAANIPALAYGLTAVAAGYTAVYAAALVANPAIGFTATLLAGAATAVGLLIAAYAGYKLGEYLVNEVELVQASVRSLYVGLSDAWTAIKVGALEAFGAIKTAWITVVDSIEDRLADLIEAFVSFSEVELPFGLTADFAYGQADAFKELARQLRDATDATGEIETATGQMNTEIADARRAAEAYAASMFDAVDELHNAKTATTDAKTATTALTPAVNAAATATDNLKSAFNGAAAAAGGVANAVGTAHTAATNATNAFSGATASAGHLSTGLDTARQRAGDFGTEIGRSSQQAGEWGVSWDLVIDEVYGAFGDFMASGMKDFGDFGDSLKRIARQMMSDLVAQFARRIILNIGVNGQGSTSGSGGFMNSIMGMFGGTGTNSSNLGINQVNAINGNVGASGNSGGMIGGGMSAGGMMGAGAGIMSGLQGIRTGNVGQGIMGGAMAGMSIGGPWGALIGAIVGGLAAAIHGKPKPDFRVGGAESNVRSPEGNFQTVFGTVRAGSRILSYEELIQPIQQFDEAIQNLVISTGGSTADLEAIGNALSHWSVDLQDGAATAENVLGSRFNAVLRTFSGDVQTFVGGVGTVEERMGRLADALTIERIAGNDNGITSSFQDMADLLLRFRDGTENLADTFARLGVGMDLVDQALGLLGTAFQGTRLEAATFAGELIQASGGIEAFSNILTGALNALFSEAERNQFVADQARTSLNAMLTGLNISGTGLDSIREQLRAALRDAMAAGNTELTTQLLQAGNALGVFANAIGALGDDAVAATNAMNFGGTSLTRGGSLTSPAGTAVAPVTVVSVGQTTNTILTQQTGLLQQIAQNTAPSRFGNGEKSGGDTATSVLVQIKGLIEQAVRTQVQEALKRTTGANKRGAVPA